MVDKLAILLIAFLLFIILFVILIYISIKHHFVEKSLTDDYDFGDDDNEDFIELEPIKEEIPNIEEKKSKKKKGRKKKNKKEKL